MENTGGGGSGGEDVLMQILVCLPVTSLLRFKSVCKSWRELIQTSFFIDLHTTATTSSSSNKFGTFILQAFESYTGQLKVKMFMLSSGSRGEDEEDDVDDDQVVFSPLYKEADSLLTGSIRMVGSCNGLICLRNSNLRDVFLWNPATRQFRILPKSITIQVQGLSKEDFFDDFIAFGFDVKTKDYKVVWITSFILPLDGPMEEGCMCRVQVYSLSTDSWRLLEGINSLPRVPAQIPLFLNQGIYLNGSYFFLGTKSVRTSDWMMLSFDFTKEIFTTTMQLPDHDVTHRMVLSNLGDKMVVSITRGDQDYEFCEIWVLNDHDSGAMNKESWTKLHSYRIKNNVALPFSPPTPLCISNKGEFALWSINVDGNKLQLFNLVTKEAKKDLTIGDEVFRADVYKQSLVSIIGGNGAVASR